MINKHRQFQEIPFEFVERSSNFGFEMVDYYNSPTGRVSPSRSRSGERGTENNPHRLMQGKVGECALALYLNLDPRHVIKWSIDSADSGWDVDFHGLLLDAKTTFEPFMLIWSRNVNDLFLKKNFHALVSVTIDETDSSRCWIEGYVSKEDFFQRKSISDGRNSNLEAGTWFMDKSVLWPITDLLHRQPIAQVAVRARKQFHYISGATPTSWLIFNQ